MYVFTCGTGGSYVVRCRKFDHGGKYIATLIHPNVNLPTEKLAGIGYIEYEHRANVQFMVHLLGTHSLKMAGTCLMEMELVRL